MKHMLHKSLQRDKITVRPLKSLKPIKPFTFATNCPQCKIAKKMRSAPTQRTISAGKIHDHLALFSR